MIQALLSHCNVHQSQNPNDVFVFGSTCFVMPSVQFVLLLSANIKENLSHFPHITLFFPVPKWVVVIVVSFPSSAVGIAHNCLRTTGMYQICKTTYSSFFIVVDMGAPVESIFPRCAMLHYTMKELWAGSVASFWC